MKDYVITLCKKISTNTYDYFELLRTSDFNHYRECRLLLVESLNKVGLCKNLRFDKRQGTCNGQKYEVEELIIITKE